MPEIAVCPTPEFVRFYDLSDKTVVVADIFRATSCMVTAFAQGIDKIIPIETTKECRTYVEKGYVIAGERGGKKIEGFDLGNSPFEYMDHNLKGKTVAVTTTNGTRAVHAAKAAKNLFVGAFLNRKALTDQLIELNNDVLIVCAGRKGQLSLEDFMFAGCLIESVKDKFTVTEDAAKTALDVYKLHRDKLGESLKKSSHGRRLLALGCEKDIDFCLKKDEYDIVPYFENGYLKV